MTRSTWLVRREGVFYLRARVPLDLVSILGKAEVKRSLGTTDPREAKRRHRAKAAEVQGEFDAVRRGAVHPGQFLRSTEPNPPSPSRIRAIVQSWFADQEARAEANEVAQPDLATEERLENLDQDRAMLADADDTNTMATAHGTAERLVQAHGLTISPSSAEHRLLTDLVRRAALESANRALRRARGDYSTSTGDPLFSAASDPLSGAPPSPVLSFAELIDQFQADPGRRVAEKTRGNRRSMFSLLLEAIGRDRPACEITRADCRRVRELLLALPPNATKRFRGLPLAEVVTRARAEGIPPMAPATINAHMSLLSEVLGWGEREGYLEENHARELQVPDTKAKDKRRSFTSDELTRYFLGPLFAPGRPLAGLQWVPLLCLFQGLRLAEACGLALDDIRSVSGVTCILIRPNADLGRRLKTESAQRIVPLHPALGDLGFLEYVAQQRQKKATRLFPDLEPGPRHDYGSVSKKLNRAIDAAEIADRKVVVHSLRHSFTDAAKEAGVPKDRLDMIMGWSGGGMDALYGSGLSPATLGIEIAKIAYPLDLSHLRRP
jgi:integrase